MKLKAKISLLVAGLFGLSIVMISLLNYNRTHDIMSHLLHDEQRLVAQGGAALIDEWFREHEAIINAGAAALVRHGAADEDGLTDILKTAMDAGGFLSVYVGFESGTFVESTGWVPPADYDHRLRPWYEKVKEERAVTHTAPYVDANTGQLIISLAAPVIEGGKFAGVTSGDISLQWLIENALSVKLGDTGYAFVVDGDGGVIIHPDKAVVSKKLQDLDPSLRDVMGKIKGGGETIVHYSYGDQEKMLSSVAVPTTGWFFCTTVNEAEVYAPLREQLWGTGILGAVFIGLGLFCSWFIARSIAAPLGATVRMIGEMENGRLDTRLRLKREDEIGQLADTMDRFADSLQEEVVGPLQRLAAGDLTFEVVPRGADDKLRGALKKLSNDLDEVLGQVMLAGSQIASGSTQVADSSQSLSQGATEQASSMEEISSSMTEMASQTKLNAENATMANSLSAQAKDAAERGNDQMVGMIEAMGEINSASQNISKIIKTIDEIAFQTNLLALNAAVEAARAGQHGKGFAVVAEEVRSLAARSAKAASETADLIEGSVAKVVNGTRIADGTAEALDEIVTGVAKVTDLVAEIAAASNEQAEGISQVNQGLSQIDQVTQQNTANAEESAAAAEELSGQGAHLQQMLDRFSLKGSVVAASPVPVQDIEWSKGEDEPSWGGAQEATEFIALDDDEFGKY